MKLHRCLLATSLLLFSYRMFAQNEADVIRYSVENLGSTGRSFGVAGAFGAIGADPSCASINPSGMARFRTSNLFLSTGFYTAKSTSSYLGQQLQDSKFNFNIPNFGFVANIRGEDYESKKPEGFVNFTFGFNLNRMNNFHKRSLFEGTNTSSITQEWAERANSTGEIPDNFSKYSIEHLAYNAWAIDKDTSSLTPKYLSAYGNNAIKVNQRGVIMSRGALNDYNVTLGANYRHILLAGIALGVKSVRYVENNNFTEDDAKTAAISDIKTVTLDKYLHTSGLGFNAKLGFTVCPTEYLRIGYAYHSPTVFNLTDSYSYTITSKFDPGARDPFGDLRQASTVSTDATIYKYKITTPGRNVFSLALVNKEMGFISMDLETVNYTSGYLQPKDPTEEPFVTENGNIKKNMNRNVLNLRLGAEAIYEQFRFRAGYARYPSPFKKGTVPFVENLVNNIYTLGFGIKTKAFSLDMAYMNSGYADYTVPYTLQTLPTGASNQTVTNNVRVSNIVISVGFLLD